MSERTRVPTNAEHDVKVAVLAVGYQPRCACGWRGVIRGASIRDAKREGDKHQEEAHDMADLYATFMGPSGDYVAPICPSCGDEVDAPGDRCGRERCADV